MLPSLILWGELAPAGASDTLVTRRVPRGCELDPKRERQREILIWGGQGTLFVLRAEAMWDETEFDLCNPTSSETTASSFFGRGAGSLLLAGPLCRHEADPIISSTSLDLARHQLCLVSDKRVILQG